MSQPNTQQPAVLGAQLDATFEQMKALSQLAASLVQLTTSMLRVPLLGAQIGTTLLAMPFLAAQIITSFLADLVSGTEQLLGTAPQREATAAERPARTAVANDGSLGSFGVRRPSFMAEYERRQDAAAAPAAPPATAEAAPAQA